MSKSAPAVFLLILFALPGAAWLVARQIHPPAFIWQQDPIVLFVNRTPVALFPGSTRAEALNDRLRVLFKDGATLAIEYQDGDEAAEQRLEQEVSELRAGGVLLEGSMPDFSYGSHPANAKDPASAATTSKDAFGRIFRAENTVVHVTALTESSLRFHVASVPLLVDQTGQNLASRLFSEHRLPALAGLFAYLALGALAGLWIFRRGRHGRRGGLPE